MKNILTAAACAVAFTSGANASTVDMDFVGLAAGLNPAYGNVDAGDYGDAEGQTFGFGGVNVTLSSDAHASSVAYLDDLSGGPGGLGVCSTGITATGQCVIRSDDNVTSGESVTLAFSASLSSFEFVFNDGNHDDISTSTDTLTYEFVGIGGTSAGTTSFVGLASVLNSVGGGITSLTLGYGGAHPDSFYLGSLSAVAVPLPASMLLLGGAVGGLGLMRRRRKAA